MYFHFYSYYIIADMIELKLNAESPFMTITLSPISISWYYV